MVDNIIVDSHSGTCQIFVSKQQNFRFIPSISLFLLAIKVWDVEVELNEENMETRNNYLWRLLLCESSIWFAFRVPNFSQRLCELLSPIPFTFS